MLGDLSLTAADFVIIGAVLISALLAMFRGFITETLAVAGWAGAAIAALTLFVPLRPFARSFIPSDLAADVGTAIVIFIVALVVISVISHLIANLVRGKGGVGLLDRALGFVFGLLRGYVLVAIVFLLLAQVYPRDDQPGWLGDAATIPLIDFAGDLLLRLVPDSTLPEDFGGLMPPDTGAAAGYNNARLLLAGVSKSV